MSLKKEELNSSEEKNHNKSLISNHSACDKNCKNIHGHMPYLYETDIVLGKLFQNGSINATKYPIFNDETWRMRTWVSEGSGFHLNQNFSRVVHFVLTIYHVG